MTTSKDDYIQQLDLQVAQLEGNIVSLVKQRAEVKRRRNAVCCAVNLPPEVLACIFEFACFSAPPVEELTAAAAKTPTTTPLLLGSVCHAWRGVAWRASQLWADITVRVRHRRADLQANLLYQWLRRSNNRLLKVKLLEDDPEDADRQTSDDDDDFFSSEDNNPRRRGGRLGKERDNGWGIDTTPTQVLSAFVAHSHQWKEIDIFVPFSWRTVLDAVRFRVPNLRKLTLRTAEGSPTLATVPHFHSAPQLKDVTLIGYSISDVELPYDQLERFVGEHFTPGECLSTLILCPNLKYCQFDQIRPGSGGDLWATTFPPSAATSSQTSSPISAYPPFQLPSLTSLFPASHHPLPNELCHSKLKSLELVIDSELDIGPLLGRLVLPSLESFILSVPDKSESSLLTHTIPLLQRSLCPLRLLHLVGATPPESDLVECLQIVPGLTHLCLVNPDIGSGFHGGEVPGTKLGGGFLGLLRPQSRYSMDGGGTNDFSTRTLLPNLRELEYRGEIGFHAAELLDLIAARWRVPRYTAILQGEEVAASTIAVDQMDRYLSVVDGMELVSPIERVALTIGRPLLFSAKQYSTLYELRTAGLKFEVTVEA